MKVVLLAGGFGTRLSEETETRPKPMLEIGGKPILWHIMKIYSHYGFNEFIVCCGYKAHMIKQYFVDYFLHRADMTINLSDNTIDIHHSNAEPWKVTLVDTGLNTMTGGRIKRIKEYLSPDEPFMLTYGDGVADIDISALLNFHREQKKQATVTVVQPAGRFGAVTFDGQDGVKIFSFQEKPKGDNVWINGGFFVLEPGVLDYIEDDNTVWERKPLETLAAQGELVAYRHRGFWKPMDTLREKRELETLWDSGSAPWKVW
ncbi:MAG: glucose-1-phosphate cytidylyltransferase [Bacteroides sp.]|nr:glucose-1-phosphate cytidylyltransferase [Ruminococcus flavefaciens]MCM1554819.1 glucose-1-phosphate cytidylyltransferase [Bacteroides sp.]